MAVAVSRRQAPHVVLVGSDDIDRRLELMSLLRRDFCLSGVGSVHSLHSRFAGRRFGYQWYPLARGVSPGMDILSISHLAGFFRQARPAIVHAFDTKPCVLARIAARLAGVPIIVGTLPGLGSLYAGNTPALRAMRALYQPLQRLACRMSDMTIFQNPDDAKQFVDSGLVRRECTHIIAGSGVRTDIFSRDAVEEGAVGALRGELGLGPDEMLITMVSRLLRTKGVLEFAVAAETVQARYPRTRFLLVGPLDHGSIDCLTPAEVALLQERVIWTGPRHDIPAVLAASDVFVLPSSYREGIPRALLEAASMGLPIVTTRSPGCDQVVADGENGLLIPVRDSTALQKAILRLVEDPGLRRRFAEESRRRAVERFDLRVIARHTRDLYKKLLAQRGMGPARWRKVPATLPAG